MLFQEDIIPFAAMEQPGCSDDFKLVPWLSWDEWEFVRKALFSSSPDQVAIALQRISTWRSRGSVPAPVDVTATLVEIQQKDGFISREEQPVDALSSEHLLQMLYCMAIVRLVNCVIEKTRKKTAVSIGEAAEAIGMPRTLIDLRHEGSHRDVPALLVLQDSANQALDWLRSYYWEPQKKQIPFKRDGIANIRKEIKSKLSELAFCLNDKQSPARGSSSCKKKFVNKHVGKTLKALVGLYTSFSSEVVEVTLKLLLKALDLSNLVELPKDSRILQNTHVLLDDWKPVITKISEKEPDLLLALLQAVLNMIDTQEQMRYETDYNSVASKVESLSSLFAWLVVRLKGLQQNEITKNELSNAIPKEFMTKCLLLSAYDNKLLRDSSLQLLELMKDSISKDKLKSLASKLTSTSNITEEHSSFTTHEILRQQEKSIADSANKLALVKIQMKNQATKTTTELDITQSSNTWVKTKTWNPCPIGMLPRVLGSSGRFPILDFDEDSYKASTKIKGSWELKQSTRKREASCDIQQLDDSSVKKMKETVEHGEPNGNGCSSPVPSVRESLINQDVLLEGISGWLMDRSWKKFRSEELLAIESAITTLI